MVGNPSIQCVTLAVLALHTTLLAPCNSIAAVEEAGGVRAGGGVRSSLETRTRHRRLRSNSNLISAIDDDGQVVMEDGETLTQQRNREEEGHRRRSGRMRRRRQQQQQQHQDGQLNNKLTPPAPSLVQLPGNNKNKSTTTTTTHTIQQRKASTLCKSPGWHNAITTEDGCSNDDNYPAVWAANPNIKKHMFFDTVEVCCDKFYRGKECQVYDSGCVFEGMEMGGDATVQQIVAEEEQVRTNNEPIVAVEQPIADTTQVVTNGPPCMWHPSMTGSSPGYRHACVYSSTYPSEWASPNLRHMYLFDSHEECCMMFDVDVGSCERQEGLCVMEEPTSAAVTTTVDPESIRVVDQQTTTSGPPCMWHPSMTGSSPGYLHACTFSSTYPADWASPELMHMYLFDSHEDCCMGTFRVGVGQCERQELLCVMPEPTGRPTMDRIATPPTPTPPPTPPPPPTLTPTSAPTSIYFIEHFTGVCQDAAFHVIPHYITKTFTDLRSCCEASFAKEKCLSLADPLLLDDGGSATDTWHPTYAPTEIIYYVEHYTGMCINSIDVPMPHWVANNATKQFTDYRDCCRSSFKKEQCLLVGQDEFPPPEPTQWPTFYSTPHPTLMPSEMPSGQPSLPTVRPTEDDCTSNVWHYVGVNGCTNLAVEDGGDDDPKLLFQSWEECCQKFFARGNDCQVDNRCFTSTTIVPFQSRPRMHLNCVNSYDYHPDVENKDGCTNSKTFPASWLDLSAEERSGLFFSTAEQCCQSAYFERGQDCNVRDVCISPTPPSCSNRHWHPDVHSEVDGCSNSENIPESWLVPPLRDAMLFDTAEKCCEEHYTKYGLQCHINNTCDETQATTTFTSTAESSLSSECESRRWHPSHDFSMCTNANLEGSSALTFDDAAACCSNVFNYPNCPSEDVCTLTGPTVTSSLSSECSSLKWHPSLDFLKCTNERLEGLNPLSFDSLESCCLNVFNYANCPAENVCTSNVATSMPSSMPTPNPTPSPTKHPTPEPTKQPSPAPIISNTISDSDITIPCGWRVMEQCNTGPCIWDTSKGYCVTPETNGEPSNRCDQMNKRQCTNDVYCGWDFHADACRCRRSLKWHPITAQDRLCTNSEEYPPLWDTPLHSEIYLFNSATECCTAFYSDGECNKIDVCDL